MKLHRIEASEGIDPASIAQHIDAGERVVVQYSTRGYSAEQLTLLNQLAKKHGRAIEIRFYGHYADVFDASVLKSLPDAQCLSIDCLTNASNLEALTHVRALTEFRFGVFELEDPDVLSYCSPDSLKVLSLGDTRRCNIDFKHLSRSIGLEQLHTTGHTKNISDICDLPLLNDLSLSSIKKKDSIEFVSNIATLKTLRIMFGGRESISQVTGKQLESLEIMRVQGLQDLGHLGRFESLQRLLIQDQIKLTDVKVGPNTELNSIRILNCQTLKQIAGIHQLRDLSTLQIYKTAIDYESFATGQLPNCLKSFAFYTGKRKLDSEICTELETRGFIWFTGA